MDYSLIHHLLNQNLYVFDTNKNPKQEEVSTINEQKAELENVPFLVLHGNKNSQVLLLVDYINADFLTSKDILFLKKILSSIQLEIENIALLNIKEQDHHFSKIPQILKALPSVTKILFFGMDSVQLTGKQFNKYEEIQGRTVKFLFADKLSDIEKEKTLKLALWNSLKQVFSIV